MITPLMAELTQDLSRSELNALVTAIAAQPDRWRHLVRTEGEDRHYEELWRDAHVDIWVISWMSGNDTGFHDHDVSQGAVAVVAGELVEEQLRIDGTSARRRHRAGEAFDFDASHVHRVLQDADAPAVSIHAYSPPLSRMGAYTVAEDGLLRRASISYVEELRPAAAAA
ncbi:MAG TPA: cysteine dioxygenase family protein [Baekduia sp.]|uniref:cysteine dioxygenase n=1 Tax=Baekduia sp. TaxID=2600305 RepID=UPI002C187530|nr:cysteine dioxygenase family protein [Baekduia sp.]HMJ36741.1 cysteine dioxygenase family protein [Baekduia sp.]